MSNPVTPVSIPPTHGEEETTPQRSSETEEAECFVSEAIEAVFQRTEVTVDSLRTLYAEILSYVGETCLGDEAIDTLF